MSTDVDDYIANAAVGVRPVVSRLRGIITDALPGADESFRWSRPTYTVDGTLVCYLATSKAHVTLGFGQGRELSDPDGLLEGSGKQMAHIKVRTDDDIDEARIRGWLQEAEGLARS